MTYRNSKNRFHSVSFQELWSAEIRIPDETWRPDRSGVLSIPPQLGLLPGSPAIRATKMRGRKIPARVAP